MLFVYVEIERVQQKRIQEGKVQVLNVQNCQVMRWEKKVII